MTSRALAPVARGPAPAPLLQREVEQTKGLALDRVSVVVLFAQLQVSLGGRVSAVAVSSTDEEGDISG